MRGWVSEVWLAGNEYQLEGKLGASSCGNSSSKSSLPLGMGLQGFRPLC